MRDLITPVWWMGAALWLVAGCSPGSGTGAKGDPGGTNAVAVTDGGAFRLATVEAKTLERAVAVTGSLLPVDQTPVSLQVAGRIEVIAVDLGSRVKQGDLIARLDAADYDLKVRQSAAALGQARARVGLPVDGTDDRVEAEKSSTVTEAKAVLEEARANRERIGALSRQGILSTSELETATAAFNVAQSRYEEALEEARIRMAQLQQRRAEYEIARKQLADTVIRAPFDGAIQERRANIGEYLSVGAPVVVLVRTDPLRLRVEVSERDAAKVRVGLPVRVSVEGDPQAYRGEVKRLSPAISEGSRTLVVEADVPALGRLRPGSFARGQIIIQAESPALTVPSESVISFAGVEKAFIVVDGRAVEKRVMTGDRGKGWVELVEGLKAGDVVVLAPGSLQTGQGVRAVTAAVAAAGVRPAEAGAGAAGKTPRSTNPPPAARPAGS